MKHLLEVLCFSLLVVISASLAFAQRGQGTINGTVQDQSGALVAGAQVTVKDVLTGTVTKLDTTSDGRYTAPFLQPGKYEVSVIKQGFATQTQSGIVLDAEQVASVNFSLKPGSESVNIEVNANATAIDTTTGSVGETIDEKTIEELPLNGRNPAALVALSPGAVDANQVTNFNTPGPGSGLPTETGATVNGSRMGGVYYQLDGMIAMNNYFQTADPFPNADATEEFHVLTNNFDAQYGYTAGAIVSVVTKSGTNQWHGNLFEFLRNNDFNAADYFSHQADPLKRNQFGGSLGGPIVKNKLFIFGNVQLTRTLLSSSEGFSYVPNNAELGGDFSAICSTGFSAAGVCNDRDSNGNVLDQIYTTWNNHDTNPGDYYPNNQVDPSTYSAFAMNVEKLLPQTTVANGAYYVTGVTKNDWTKEYTVRSDYNISNSQRLMGRVFYYNYNRPGYASPGNLLGMIGDARGWTGNALNLTFSHTWTINPNLVNSFSIGYHRNNTASTPGFAPITFQDLGANLADESQWFGWFGDGGSTGSGFFSQGIPVVQGRHNWNFAETISWTKAKHTIVAGGNVLTQYGLEQATWEGDPGVSFNGAVTGDSDLDFLLGLPNNIQASGGEFNKYGATNMAIFGQDSIKLTPSLTVNLGLRWEPQIAPVSLDHRKTVDFIPGEQSQRFTNAPVGMVYPGDPGIPAGGWANEWGQFLPRLSFAWAPNELPKTSIRGAFAVMDIPYDYSYYNHQSANAPFSPAYNINYNQVGTCTLTIADPFACYAPTNFVDPFPPFAGPGLQPASDVAFSSVQALQAVFTKGFQQGKEFSWNFGIQHAFGNAFLVTGTYIGRHDNNTHVPIQLSPGVYNCAPVGPNCTQAQFNLDGQPLLWPDPNGPGYQSILAYESIGRDNYDALQIAVEKRFSKGLEFTSNFTWSKALDISSQASISNVGSVYNPYNPKAAYGISDHDIPRIWNTTFVYQMPALHSLGSAGNAVLGGWQIGGLWLLHSGQAMSINGGTNPLSPCGQNNASCSDVNSDFADRVPGQPLNVHQGGKAHWLNEYFNTAAFIYNANGTFGNSGRNSMFGPGWNEADLNFSKNFNFKERYRIQIRWEMFNAFNRTEFSNPNNTWNPAGTSNFGQITGDNGLTYFSPTSARLCQAAMKFYF
jgi:Carboxypeptidase regulatory-like domain